MFLLFFFFLVFFFFVVYFIYLNLLLYFVFFLCKGRLALQSNTQFSLCLKFENNSSGKRKSEEHWKIFLDRIFLVLADDQISDFSRHHAVNVVNPNLALCLAVAVLLQQI